MIIKDIQNTSTLKGHNLTNYYIKSHCHFLFYLLLIIFALFRIIFINLFIVKIALEFLFYLSIVVVIYLIIRIIFGLGQKTVSIKKINKLFKKIDKKYEHFLEKKVKNIFLDKENHKTEIEKLAGLCITVLKPEIDGIYALVRLKAKPDGGINFSSKYFGGVIALTEALMLRDTKKYRLTNKDYQDFIQAFRVNLISDITERVYINEFDE